MARTKIKQITIRAQILKLGIKLPQIAFNVSRGSERITPLAWRTYILIFRLFKWNRLLNNYSYYKKFANHKKFIINIHYYHHKKKSSNYVFGYNLSSKINISGTILIYIAPNFPASPSRRVHIIIFNK